MLFGLMQTFERISTFFARLYNSKPSKILFSSLAPVALAMPLFQLWLERIEIEHARAEKHPRIIMVTGRVGRIQIQEAERRKSELAGHKLCSMDEACRITRR